MKFDEINKAEHYNVSPAKCANCSHPIECIDVVQHMSFNLGNCVKYIWRAGKKGTAIKDLEKARYYLDKAIKLGNDVQEHARLGKQLESELAHITQKPKPAPPAEYNEG